jgi:hypothetical protein
MGANCCAADDKDDHIVDIDKEKREQNSKKKRKSKRISERRKKGAEVSTPQAEAYDENDPDTLIPQVPSPKPQNPKTPMFIF